MFQSHDMLFKYSVNIVDTRAYMGIFVSFTLTMRNLK